SRRQGHKIGRETIPPFKVGTIRGRGAEAWDASLLAALVPGALDHESQAGGLDVDEEKAAIVRKTATTELRTIVVVVGDDEEFSVLSGSNDVLLAAPIFKHVKASLGSDADVVGGLE